MDQPITETVRDMKDFEFDPIVPGPSPGSAP